VVFFATLYRSTLSTLLSRCIHLNHSFFSLIAFCTFSFNYHVSLVSCLPPLFTLNFSEATFLMQVAIFIHIIFASPPLCQGPSLRTLLEHPRYHFIFDAWTHLLHWMQTRKQKFTIISLCWEMTHSPDITLQSKQACISSLLARIKLIWLQYWPLLKVTRWEILFLKRVFATIKS
jgi:hypothetical protein